MNNSGVIETSKSADLASFTILSGGNALPGTIQVMSVSVSKEVNRIPVATIVIKDGDTAEQDFLISNEDLFKPGTELEIAAGYHSEEETIFKGIVIKHSLKIKSGTSLLIIECKDEAVKMTIGRKSNFFYENKDSDIFDEIISEYKGLTSEIEATKYEHEELVQYNSSDWDFVLSRAQANGKLCIVDDGAIKIAKPDVGQAEIETVTFGSSLMDFDAEIDARNQVKGATAYSWNQSDQELIEVDGEDPGIDLNGDLTPSELSDVIGLTSYELRHGGSLNDSELQDWADATLLWQQLSKVRGRARFQGIPAVKPNTILKLEGVGNRFNGNIYITGVLHTISNGDWVTDAQFGLNPQWFSETFDISTQPASGLLPAIKGLHVGIVSQLEEDPNGEDRILVKLPIVNSDEQGIWCRVSTLDAGDSRGSFFRPEIEDEVLVGFINEDPNDPVVLGMLNSSAKPAPIAATDDNHEKGFVTRSEMKLLFDDDKPSITIETPGGKIVTIDDDAGEIKLEDDNSNIITMSSDGITIESGGDINITATGDINMEGTNIAVAANAEFTAEGQAGVELSTSAIAVVSGSIVQIN